MFKTFFFQKTYFQATKGQFAISIIIFSIAPVIGGVIGMVMTSFDFEFDEFPFQILQGCIFSYFFEKNFHLFLIHFFIQ